MSNIIIFGAPGSGKGTQSERLIAKYNLRHISTGELLRDHIARKTELGIVADSYCSRGQLIPDDLMIEILAHTIDNDPEISKGLILDGFPRTIPQARALKQLLAERGMKIDSVIGLKFRKRNLWNVFSNADRNPAVQMTISTPSTSVLKYTTTRPSPCATTTSTKANTVLSTPQAQSTKYSTASPKP